MIDPQMRDAEAGVTDRVLREFAGLWLIIIGGIGLFNGLVGQRFTMAVILAVVAVVPGLIGLASPRRIEPLFRAALGITMPIGWLISHALLAAIFYLVITPVALWFKVTGRDALKRRIDAGSSTQWVERPHTIDASRYWHQS